MAKELIFGHFSLNATTGSKAPPWNPLPCRLRLQYCEAFVFRFHRGAWQSLGSNPFAGRALVRETKPVVFNEMC